MKINRLLSNICSSNLQESAQFYTSLFAFSVAYESDWFIQLVSEGRELELGIIDAEHEIVPPQTQGDVRGVYLTFVVDDLEPVYQKAKSLGYSITQAPAITFYGQYRMLIMAPEGTVCDVSSPIQE